MRRALFAMLLISAVPFTASAAVEETVHDPEKMSFYRIVISPLRFIQKLSHIPENMTVLDEETLDSLPASDPSEALRSVSGVDVSSRTGFGHIVPLSIRGSESRHVLVMVDGIPFNTQASGQADILPSLPMNSLERIEVLKGPASSAWGSSLGGLIHLVTKTPEHTDVPKGKVTTSWGEFRSQKQSFEANASAGLFDFLLSGEYLESAGARTRSATPNLDDTLQKKGFAKFVYPFSDVITSTVSYGYSDVELNEGVYPSDGTRQHVPYTTRYALFRVDSDPDERRHAEASFKMNRQLISVDTLDPGTSNILSSGVRTQDHYYGGELKGVWKLREEDLLVAGADLNTHVLKSSQMDSSRDIVAGAPYANYTYVAGPFDLVGGARHDMNTEFGDQFDPSFGAVYHVPGAERTLVRANAARSFSAPPLLWKFFEDASPGFTANNPDLKPERAWTFDLGAETQVWEPLWLKFGVFRSDIRDAIATVERADGFFIKQNFDKFRQLGFEFESRYAIRKDLVLSFAAEFNDVENETTGLTVRNRGVSRPGYRLGLEGEAPYGLRFNVLGRYQRWDSSASARPNDRKFIFDARLSKSFEGGRGTEWTAFLNGYNLTNSKYWSNLDFPLPERYFEGGVSFEF